MENEIEQLVERQKTRTIVMGVIIGILFVINVCLYFYGKIESMEAEKNHTEANQAKDKLEMCMREAEKQRQMAERAAMEARKAQLQAEEALQKALKK